MSKVDEDLLKYINQSFVSGKISPTQRMDLLGIIIGDEQLTDHKQDDFDFSIEHIRKEA